MPAGGGGRSGRSTGTPGPARPGRGPRPRRVTGDRPGDAPHHLDLGHHVVREPLLPGERRGTVLHVVTLGPCRGRTVRACGVRRANVGPERSPWGWKEFGSVGVAVWKVAGCQVREVEDTGACATDRLGPLPRRVPHPEPGHHRTGADPVPRPRRVPVRLAARRRRPGRAHRRRRLWERAGRTGGAPLDRNGPFRRGAHAAGQAARSALVLGDATRLPVCEGVVDVVVCSLSLILVRPLDAALGEIRRVLGPAASSGSCCRRYLRSPRRTVGACTVLLVGPLDHAVPADAAAQRCRGGAGRTGWSSPTTRAVSRSGSTSRSTRPLRGLVVSARGLPDRRAAARRRARAMVPVDIGCPCDG